MATRTPEERKAVAETILEQLGGRRFVAMTGAKQMHYGLDGSLSFRLPIGKAGAVLIELTPMDVYTVTFFGRTRRPHQPKKLSIHEDVYAEDLVRLFERETGLATSLGRIVAS